MNDHQKQIYRYLLDRIAAGEILIGEKLPTENQLAEQFSTGRLNAHYAVKALERAGILRCDRRRGTTQLRCPQEYELGQLLLPVSRKVCVLNHSQLNYRNIHWNDRILIPLRTMLARHRIDFEERLIDDTMTPERYQQMLFELIRQGCGGLVVVPGGNWDRILADRPELLFRFRNHIHLFDRGGIMPDCSWCNIVGINNIRDGALALETAMSTHPSRIVFCLLGVKHARFQLERFRGVEESMPRYGQQAVKLITYQPDMNGHYSQFAEDFRPDTAFIACNDRAAVRLIDTARAAGYEPGRDYKLISFDDDRRFADYHLTTLSPNLELIAQLLAEELIAAIDGRHPDFTSTHRIISKVIRRDTM